MRIYSDSGAMCQPTWYHQTACLTNVDGREVALVGGANAI